MIRLKVLEGSDKGQTFESKQRSLTIGRSPSNDLVVQESHISGVHGRITIDDDGRVLYRDLRSTNGSEILRGEERLALNQDNAWQSELRDGDHLVLGDLQSPIIVHCRLGSLEEELGARTSFSPAAVTRQVDKLDHSVLALKHIHEVSAFVDRVERNPRTLECLYRFAKDLTQSLDLQEVLEIILSSLFEILPGATHLGIMLRDVKKDRFVPVAARQRDVPPGQGESIELSRSILNRVLDDRAGVLCGDARMDIQESKSIFGAKIRSSLCVPLWKGEEIKGILQVDNRATVDVFHEEDLELLTILAGQATLAIENAILYQKLKLAEEQLKRENIYLKGKEKSRFEVANIIGQSPAMKAVFKQLKMVVGTNVTVYIEGETGTGKELIAHAVHYQSTRREKLFVTQNCAAMPENLLESELFGHKRGSFTGAEQDKKGLLEIADGGTVFLDEVGDMPMAMQVKLLRFLQEGELRPVGANKSKQVDVRVLSATNRDLEKEVEAGRFREDLYYRLKVFPIIMPPLRERREDIPLLAGHFLASFCKEINKPIAGFSQQTMDLLIAHAWPGNIRELENEVQRLVIQSDPEAFILPELLSPAIRKAETILAKVAPKRGTLKQMVEEVENWIIQQALGEHGGNKSQAAKELGITREGLHKKLAKYKH